MLPGLKKQVLSTYHMYAAIPPLGSHVACLIFIAKLTCSYEFIHWKIHPRN